MKDGQVKLGLCPIGKFVFSHEDALRQKRLIQERLRAWEISFVDLEGVVEDGLVRDQGQVDAVVAHLQRAQVDAVFMPHCNFGTEGAVGMIGRKLGLPVLLWGPRDEPPQPDGTRLRDTLCGLFASSKVLHKLGVPFTYIENCRIDEPAFCAGVERFLRATAAADLFRRGTRIGLIGQRIDFFWTTISNESELLERFNIEVVPIDMVTFIERVGGRIERQGAAYAAEIADLRRDWLIEQTDDPALARVLAVRDEMLAAAEENGLEALALQDFMSLVEKMGAWCFLANSMVGERYPIGCESDVLGAVSTALLRRVSLGATAPFLADLTVRHPQRDDVALLWHAGAPLSMKAPSAQVRLADHWILPGAYGGMTHFPLRTGDITVARFDGDGGAYQLAIGEGVGVDGPETLNNYVWMQVADWPRWERRLMEGPFMHHVGMTYGHYGAALAEACKYIDGVEPLLLDA